MVKENIKRKFQDHKLVLVDEVLELDKESRELTLMCDDLRMKRNAISKEIGGLMAKGLKEEAEAKKAEVNEINEKLAANEGREEELKEEIKTRMMKIPNIIDASVPIGEDDSKNVENEKFGEPVVPAYEIPHHADIVESLNGLDKESAGRTSGNGFYFLFGNIARLHEAMLAYARDFMINQGFTYAIPPFTTSLLIIKGGIA